MRDGEVAPFLRELRTKTGFTQEEFAEYFGLDLQFYKDLEEGRAYPKDYLPECLAGQYELLKNEDGSLPPERSTQFALTEDDFKKGIATNAQKREIVNKERNLLIK